MARKKFKPEEIIQNLRTVEIEQSKGATLQEAARKVGSKLPVSHSMAKRIRGARC